MRINGTNLSFTRGDTESITITIKDIDEVQIPLVNGDTVYFTVKTNTDTTDIILQKVITSFTGGSAIIELTHADTKDLTVDSYVYDVQVTYADGTVTTIIKPSSLKIRSEVTYD